MLKRRSKHFALLLVLTMLATMFVGVGTASAASTYTTSSTPSLVKGTLYAPTLGTPLNRIAVKIPEGQLIGNTTVRVSLPSGYAFIPQVPALPTVNQIATVAIDPVAGSNVTVPTSATGYTAVPAAFTAAIPAGPAGGAYNYDGDAYREWDITVNGPSVAPDEVGVFYLDLYYVYVKAGADDGDLAITVDAPPTSSLSSARINIGTIGAGTSNITIADINTITSTGGAINTLRIKEDRASALEPGTNSIKLKLPNGFTWRNPAAIAGALVWGDTLGVAVPLAGDFTRADSDRTLCIEIPAASTDATYFTVTGLAIDVDESVAKVGEIVATISGSSSIKESEITVGKYAEFSIAVAAFGDPENVIAGRDDQEIAAIKIDEGVAASLVPGRTVTLQLIGNAKWRTTTTDVLDNAPRVKTSDSKNNCLTTPGGALSGGSIWDPVGSNGDTIKTTVGASVGKASIVLDKGEIAIDPAATGEIKIKVGGTAGATGEIVVANVVKPVTAKIDGAVKDVVIGTQGQEIAPIILEEGIKEAFDSTTGQNSVRIQFPHGIIVGKPTKVEVIEGDLAIDQNTIGVTAVADGRWGINFDIKAMSTVPSKIKIEGVKLVVDRTVPEGTINADVRGTALVQTLVNRYFPSSPVVFGNLTVANSVTPAPGVVKAEASFVIGATNYTLNGVESTMDVAPYIKDSRTYMPIRYVAYAMGINDANILWDGAKQTVTLMKGDKVVQLTIGSNLITINGAAVTMDVAPEITNDRTMLPIRFVANAFGADAEWDAATQTVTIK